MNDNVYDSRITDLLSEGVVLFDSAMGTYLMATGAFRLGGGAGRANLDSRRVVHDIHMRNIQAGSDVVTTNTFNVHVGDGIHRGRDSFSEEEMLRAGVRIARKTASEATAPGGTAEGRRVFTALDIGPIGGIIGLTNNMTHDESVEIFARTAGIGADEGADLILIETMVDLAEALDAITAARSETDLPVICSMAFEAAGRTSMGVSPHEFVRAAIEAGADAVGANCSVGPSGMSSIAEALAAAAGDVPVLVQPNAGLPRMDGAEVYYGITPAEFADGVYDMIAAGVRLVGGCCGTTPEMIACLKERIG